MPALEESIPTNTIVALHSPSLVLGDSAASICSSTEACHQSELLAKDYTSNSYYGLSGPQKNNSFNQTSMVQQEPTAVSPSRSSTTYNTRVLQQQRNLYEVASIAPATINIQSQGFQNGPPASGQTGSSI